MTKKQAERTLFGARMFESRKNSGLSQEVVCERIGCSQGTLSELERLYEGSALTPQFAKLYKVNSHWLATGQGNPLSKDGKLSDQDLNPQEMELLNSFRLLGSDAIRSEVLRFANLIKPLDESGNNPTNKKKKAG